jgi:hypothetical protein
MTGLSRLDQERSDDRVADIKKPWIQPKFTIAPLQTALSKKPVASNMIDHWEHCGFIDSVAGSQSQHGLLPQARLLRTATRLGRRPAR